ncbi:MAG TPA: PadR family transcriptional regulator [Solirubrobacteraceae bacterium]|nr:PadR family transcriptional regulator [Solirubrobacteraceae bacterium]
MSSSGLDPLPAALSATARVVLGLIPFGKRTGYEMKTFVDRTTRYFWAASYGQIYPELKKLEERGFVHGRPEPSGGRARTVYELTEEGETALKAWLASEEEPYYELRDEGMLKLFFSDSLPGQRIEILRSIRQREERGLAHLRSIEPHASKGPTGAHLTLQMGIGLTEWTIEWCTQTERRLAKDTEKE